MPPISGDDWGMVQMALFYPHYLHFCWLHSPTSFESPRRSEVIFPHVPMTSPTMLIYIATMMMGYNPNIMFFPTILIDFFGSSHVFILQIFVSC